MHFLHNKIIGAPKIFLKIAPPQFRPKTNHTFHQKTNLSRETVPLISVADPGSGMGESQHPDPGSGIRDEQPGSYFLELRNQFFCFFLG
jgi:hypothetical protein